MTNIVVWQENFCTITVGPMIHALPLGHFTGLDLLALAFLALAFLNFVWSHRIFGYCAIVMAAVPNDVADPLTPVRSAQAADLDIRAARSFNRRLRNVYFSLGALAWLLGPLALILATATTVGILLRREFASHSRQVLMRNTPM